MKKKHLKSLQSIEQWLRKQSTLTADHQQAFEVLKNAIESIEESTEAKESNFDVLPPPKEIEDPQTLALYSDGGCRGNPGPGAFAFLVQNIEGKVIAEGVEYESLTTNNKMELSGPLKGLQELQGLLPEPRLQKVRVITDSKYVVDGMKSWVAGWKSRGWKKADNKAPENLDLWKDLDAIKDQFLQVEWVWVKGHAGHPQNEYCDRKANEVMDAHSS